VSPSAHEIEPSPSSGAVRLDAETSGLIIAEYQSLRAEIVKMMEMQSQLVSLAVIGFGAVLSFGFETRNPVVILVYPMLAGILQIYWLNHAHAVQHIADYLADVVEPKAGKGVLGWENYGRTNPVHYPRFGYWGVRVIFMLSATLAVVVAPIVGRLDGGALVFFIAAVIVTLGVIVMSVMLREPLKQQISE